MADNKSVSDASGTPFNVRTDQIGGVDLQVVKVAWGASDVETLVDDVDTKRLPVTGKVGGYSDNPSAQITRPNDTTPYDVGDLIANATTAASVSYGALTATRFAAGSCRIDRVRLASGMTSALVNVVVRARLWAAAAPRYDAGDNAAYAVSPSNTGALYLGSYTGVFEVFGDKSTAILTPEYGAARVKLGAGAQTIFWDVQALTAFTPTAAAFFALIAEVAQD